MPRNMKIVQIIVNFWNYFHNHTDRAMSAMAHTPNNVFRHCIVKNKDGLPGFILCLIDGSVSKFYLLLYSYLTKL